MPSASPASEHARAEAAHRNGVLSRGPTTPDGKARSARNSLRHGLCGKTPVLSTDEDAAAFAALRGALVARHLPRDEVEAHWVEELAFAAWRQRRLRALEAAALARAGAVPDDADPSPALLSLATLIRYRARLDRDWRRANEELQALRRDRAVEPSPAQLRLVADLIEQGRMAAPDCAAEEYTNENQPGMNEPDAPATTDKPAPGVGTDEPTAATNGPNEFTRRTDEPRHPVPPLPELSTDEPIPPARPLNRHQRRRLAALARLGLHRAA